VYVRLEEDNPVAEEFELSLWLAAMCCSCALFLRWWCLFQLMMCNYFFFLNDMAVVPTLIKKNPELSIQY
jgi:hypothetical protein